MWAASYNSGGSILNFLQDVKLCFTTAAPNGTKVAHMGLKWGMATANVEEAVGVIQGLAAVVIEQQLASRDLSTQT